MDVEENKHIEGVGYKLNDSKFWIEDSGGLWQALVESESGNVAPTHPWNYVATPTNIRLTSLLESGGFNAQGSMPCTVSQGF